MTILVDAQYLTSDGTVKGGAAELFFKHRDEVIFEKVKEEPDYDYLPREDYARSRLEFPSFHRNWIDGILTSCLKALNHNPTAKNFGTENAVVLTPQPQPGAIVDPLFVYKNFIASDPSGSLGASEPSLKLPDIVPYFALPGDAGLNKAGVDCIAIPVLTPPPEATALAETFKAAAAETTKTEYKKRNPEDYLLNPPSDEFPDLEYSDGDEEGLSLKNKQIKLIQAVIDAHDQLVEEVTAKPSLYLFPISLGKVAATSDKPQKGQQLPGPALLPIFEAAQEALDDNMPDPSQFAENAISNIANYEGLKRMLVKPLYLATIGVLFGSHPKGFTGLMSMETPDAVGQLNLTKADPKPENLDLDMRGVAGVAEVTAGGVSQGPDPGDANRNGVPIRRHENIPNKYKNVGTGIKTSTYRKYRDIGKLFIQSHPVNANADDNHKGLMFVFVMGHETGMDPGVANAGYDEKSGKWLTGEPGKQSYSDSFIWGASIGIINTTVTSINSKTFIRSAVWNPTGNPDEKGIDIDKQLDYYIEYLGRNLAILGANLQNPKTNKPAISGGRGGLTPYGGPEPAIQQKLANELKSVWSQGVRDGASGIPTYIPQSIGGGGQQRDAAHKEYTEPFYYMHSCYDIYNFHIGILGNDSYALGSSPPNQWEQKHVISFTMAQRGYWLCEKGEHVQRYMESTGMSSIDFDQLAIVGLRQYVSPQGNVIKPFPKADIWVNENSSEISAHNKRFAERKKKS